jgi:hypothetical protein
VTFICIVSAIICGLPTPFCQAADVKSKPPLTLDLTHYFQLLRQQTGKVRPPEIVEMLSAIAHGSQMGPGEGWFHGSQSRYGWEWLAARYDADHNGTITRHEFDDPSELFERLDRNHDGVLTPADFDWSDRSSFARQSMPSRFWFRSIDRNSNGRISREEWQAFFDKVAKGKNYLTPDDLREALPVAPPSPPPDTAKKKNDGPSPLVLLKGLLSGELGSVFEGPDIGQQAPDFTLKTQDGKKQIRLSQFRGQKPVVLIFGSFT